MPLYARLWTDILDDPKLRQAVDEGAKHLVLLPWLIAWAKRADADGRIEISGKIAKPRQIAKSIPNANQRSVAKSLAELEHIGILSCDPDGCYRFTAWEYRNSGKASDSKEAVAARVRAHRDRKKKVGNAVGNARNALQGVTDVTDVTSKRVERREERGESKRESEENSEVGRERFSTAPPRRKRPKLSVDVRAFGKHFYGAAPRDRQESIYRQLVATLNGGAKLGRHRVVAGSIARLDAKCREVIAEGVNDPDKAIVVLLKKLGDVSDDSPTERAAAEDKREEQQTAVRLARAFAWIETNPDLAAVLEREVEDRFAEEQQKLAKPIAKPYADLTLRFYRNAAVLKAWADAGEPTDGGAST